jgi:outer membrane lipoprotein-sorting protein
VRNARQIAILVTLAALGSGAAVRAVVTGDAQVWLEAMAKAQSDGPLRYDYSVETSGAGGAAIAATVTGQVTQQGERMRSVMTTTTAMGGTEMKIEMLAVSDGQTMWVETTNPMTGKQVMKMSVEQMKSMAEKMGGMGLPGGKGGGSLDPLDQIDEMSKMFDFEVLEERADSVTLQGKLTADALAQAEAQGAAPVKAALQAFGNYRLVLDKNTGFPREMSFGGEPPATVVRFSNYERLKDLDPETFGYTPPAGAMVMDMSVSQAPGSQTR